MYKKDFVNLGRTPEEKGLIDRKVSVNFLEKELISVQKSILQLKMLMGNEKQFKSYLYQVQKTVDMFKCRVVQQIIESHKEVMEKENAKLH